MEDRLRKFAGVVDNGGFVRAAEDLRISQPALSTAISKLERELGASLFTRRKPPLKLSRSGEVAYRYAKQLDSSTSNFKMELSKLAGDKPLLAIGMIDSVADALFVRANYLSELRKQARVSLSVNNSTYLASALERGELDMALVAQPRNLGQTLHLTPLGSEPLMTVASPSIVDDVRKSLASGTLPNFLSYNKGSNTNILIRQYFISKGVEPQPIFSSTSPEILLHLVLSGEGTAALPYLMVKSSLANGSLVSITSPIPRQIISLEQKGKIAPPPLIELRNNVQALLAQLNVESRQYSENSAL